MIALTLINYLAVLLNSDQIETIEAAPDTVIYLRNGRRLIVREHAHEIAERVREIRGSLLRRAGATKSLYA